MNPTELVLCIKKKSLPEKWVERKSVVPLELGQFINACSLAGFEFINRTEAEKNPSLKQIIPYIILQTEDQKKTAVYSRQGSEQRLHDLWSMGIGGHINPVDMDASTDSFQKILTTGMERELEEELVQRPEGYVPTFAGVISEDTTDVGKVHLGAVFRILTPFPEKFLPGEELSEFKWIQTTDLAHYNLELWSKLALKLIGEPSGI